MLRVDVSSSEVVPGSSSSSSSSSNMICYQLIIPSTRIFQCGAGHLVCGECRPKLKVGVILIFPILQFILHISGVSKQMWASTGRACCRDGKLYCTNQCHNGQGGEAGGERERQRLCGGSGQLNVFYQAPKGHRQSKKSVLQVSSHIILWNENLSKSFS